MFRAIRALNSRTTSKPLLVDTEKGVTVDPDTQVEIMTDFFEKMFCKTNIAGLPEIPSKEMTTQFTRMEVAKAVKSLKNHKSPGLDSLQNEQLK